MTNNILSASNKSNQPALWYGSIAFFGSFHLIAIIFAPWFFSWSALGVAVFLHWLTGSIGICLGYHRLLTHHSLEVPQWLEKILVTCGALALQGGPVFWVAGHNLHHAHTEDNENDPYSANKGFWWSHVGWLLYKQEKYFNYDQYKKYALRVNKDPYYRWLNNYQNLFGLQVILGLVLYALGGWSFVIYGVFVRTVVLWHCTWFVNSATHCWGYKNFESKDGSLNLWWVALTTYGEGWHNNHHFRPHVAKSGHLWWEIDATWWVIRVLQILGLTKKVVTP